MVPVMVTSAPMMLQGQQWWEVGFGLNDMTNGGAVGSDWRCRCISMSNLVFG